MVTYRQTKKGNCVTYMEPNARACAVKKNTTWLTQEGWMVRQVPQLLQPTAPKTSPHMLWAMKTAWLQWRPITQGMEHSVGVPGKSWLAMFFSHLIIPEEIVITPCDSLEQNVKHWRCESQMSLKRKYLEYLGLPTYMAHSVSSPFHSCFLVPKFHGTWRPRGRDADSIGDRALSGIYQAMIFSLLSHPDVQI